MLQLINRVQNLHELKKNEWPLLPIILVCVILLIEKITQWRSAWLADFVAFLAAFSIIQAVTVLLQKANCAERPTLRLSVLGASIFAAIFLGNELQKLTWPDNISPHFFWLLPFALGCFVITCLIPNEFRIAASKKTKLAVLEERARNETEKLLLEARLAALQAQIEPHFLYNTIATARALVTQKPAAAEEMLTYLITYLRASLPDLKSSLTTLGNELERALAYLEIIKLRFGDRLFFQLNASEEARQCVIPPLAIMTLVENSIKHGIEPKVEGGEININAHCEDGYIHIVVSDNGLGFQSELGGGLGLINLQDRLFLLYGDKAKLNIVPGDKGGVSVGFKIPIIEKSPSLVKNYVS